MAVENRKYVKEYGPVCLLSLSSGGFQSFKSLLYIHLKIS